MRVAVIGAGAAGLCALRHLSARQDIFQPMAFEQSAVVGGTWVYTEKKGHDDNGLPIHSSMYSNLLTNLPKEVMAYPDFPFPRHLQSFLDHQTVRSYLEDYADHFDLRKYIKLNTVVERVHPERVMCGDEESIQWSVTSRDVTEAEDAAQHMKFDAVIVCNGHYSVPLMPDLRGASSFRGEILHSHDYRHPEDFAGKRVFCLGAAASGVDIALDLASHAQQVYLGHRKARLQSPLPDNVEQTAAISHIAPESLVLEDGQEVKVDVLMCCTGYLFTFPFLSSECSIAINDERVTPLYKHIIHTRLPNLSFIGIPKTVAPFPMFDLQVRFVIAALDGEMALPSCEEMEADTQKDYEWRLSIGMPHRYAHTMGQLQWPYNDELAQLAGFSPLPLAVQNLYDHVHDTRSKQLQEYKKRSYELVESDSFRIL